MCVNPSRYQNSWLSLYTVFFFCSRTYAHPRAEIAGRIHTMHHNNIASGTGWFIWKTLFRSKAYFKQNKFNGVVINAPVNTQGTTIGACPYTCAGLAWLDSARQGFAFPSQQGYLFAGVSFTANEMPLRVSKSSNPVTWFALLTVRCLAQFCTLIQYSHRDFNPFLQHQAWETG